MLLTPAAYREQSRLYQQAAKDARSRENKLKLARHALTLAQLAEAIERDTRGEKTKEHERLLAEAVAEVEHPAPLEKKAADDERLRVKRWRMRAEELRTIAAGLSEPMARESLQRAATNYDHLADGAEARLAGRPRGASDKAG